MAKNSGYSVASLVLGIVSLVSKFIPFISFISVICAILAIVFGLMAKSEVENSSGQTSGKEMASAGFIMGLISLGLYILGLIACGAIVNSAFFRIY